MSEAKAKTEAWIPSKQTQEEIARMSANIDQMMGLRRQYIRGVAGQLGVPKAATYDLASGEFKVPDKADDATA